MADRSFSFKFHGHTKKGTDDLEQVLSCAATNLVPPSFGSTAGGACDSYEALFTAFCAVFSEDKSLQNFLTSLSAAAATLSQPQRKADLRAQLSFHLEDAKTQTIKPLHSFAAADIPDGAVIQVHLNPHASAPPVSGTEEHNQPKKRR